MAQITVKMVRSKIGCNPNQKKTLEALGLHKIRQEKTFEESRTVLGMINKVKHLVEVTKS